MFEITMSSLELCHRLEDGSGWKYINIVVNGSRNGMNLWR